MVGTFSELFAFDHWANSRIVAALRESGEPPKDCVKLLAHILAAQRVWYSRITGADLSSLVIWPEKTLEECAAEVSALKDGWERNLSSVTENPGREISYLTSKGDEFTSRVVDILRQVIMHGVHHRAQISQSLRAAGQTPPLIDYIFFCRERA